MSTLHFLADDRAELVTGGTTRCRPTPRSAGSSTITSTTMTLGQSNCATNVVLGGFCSTGVIANAQGNCAVQGIA